MIRGRIALGGLSIEFGDTRRRFEDRAEEVRRMAEVHADLLKEEGEVVRALAEHYLPELSPGAVSAGLAEMEARLREALREQEAHRAALVEDLETAEREVAAQQERAQSLEPAEAEAADRVRRCRAAAEAQLDADPEYLRWRREHDAALERREVLRKRRARLASTGNFERRRYEASRPFTWLRDRGWGTPDYRGGWLRRRLEGWLARRIDYEELARRELILRAGPGLTHAEIEELRASAAELERRMDERESRALADAGFGEVLPAWEETNRGLEAERERLDRLRERRDRLVAELQRVDARKGQPWEEAIRSHHDFLSGESIAALEERAARTPEAEDDELVRRLGSLRERVSESERALQSARTELERLAGRTGKLADLKRAATRRFIEPRASFPEEFRLEKTLGPLLAGESEVAEVLEVLDGQDVSDGLFAEAGRRLEGWIGELEARFGTEAHIVEQTIDEVTDILVFDAEGRVVSRRVTHRRPGPGSTD